MKPAAFKLPHLLATLPRSGRNMLVRQVDWPTNSFVKVARTKLRYLETGDNKPLKAAGKAWGYLFWKGKLATPRAGAPIPKITGGLKHLWLEVDSASLTAEERAAIAEGDAKVAEMQKAADESRAARRRANLEKIAAKSQQA